MASITRSARGGRCWVSGCCEFGGPLLELDLGWCVPSTVAEVDGVRACEVPVGGVFELVECGAFGGGIRDGSDDLKTAFSHTSTYITRDSKKLHHTYNETRNPLP